MESRDERIYEEAAALWREVFGEPPPARTDPRVILDMIISNVSEASYERLRSPFLRPSTIVGPAQPRDDQQLD
jgi:hypothetical protein